MAVARENDRRGRPLPIWQGCRMIAEGEVFLMNWQSADSMDGRYFRPLPAASIVGRAAPTGPSRSRDHTNLLKTIFDFSARSQARENLNSHESWHHVSTPFCRCDARSPRNCGSLSPLMLAGRGRRESHAEKPDRRSEFLSLVD